MSKPIEKLTISDLKEHPIWEFDLTNEGKPGRDETWVKPVEDLPVYDLGNRVLGIEVGLANGSTTEVLLANVNLEVPELNEEFICISFLKEDKSTFHLSRYFDSDYDNHNPEALSKYLNLSIDEIFPISYDISKFCKGKPETVKAKIRAVPTKKLNDDERMELIIQNM